MWRERLGGIFTASPVAGAGKIHLLSETGETIVLRAGRTPSPIPTRPTVDDRTPSTRGDGSMTPYF